MPIVFLYIIALICITIRRLHDFNLSAWFLLSYIFVHDTAVMLLYPFVIALIPGSKGLNKYDLLSPPETTASTESTVESTALASTESTVESTALASTESRAEQHIQQANPLALLFQHLLALLKAIKLRLLSLIEKIRLKHVIILVSTTILIYLGLFIQEELEKPVFDLTQFKNPLQMQMTLIQDERQKTRSFYISVKEVSMMEYQICVALGYCTMATKQDDDNQGDALDVADQITRSQANDFAKWIGGYLAIEDEFQQVFESNPQLSQQLFDLSKKIEHSSVLEAEKKNTEQKIRNIKILDQDNKKINLGFRVAIKL